MMLISNFKQRTKRIGLMHLLIYNEIISKIQNLTQVIAIFATCQWTIQSFALKRSTLYRNTVHSVFRLGTIDGRTLARLDDVVDAERGLIAAGFSRTL